MHRLLVLKVHNKDEKLVSESRLCTNRFSGNHKEAGGEESRSLCKKQKGTKSLIFMNLKDYFCPFYNF
jgi:hypothetical protein